MKNVERLFVGAHVTTISGRNCLSVLFLCRVVESLDPFVLILPFSVSFLLLLLSVCTLCFFFLFFFLRAPQI